MINEVVPANEYCGDFIPQDNLENLAINQDQQEIDLVIEENQTFHAIEIKWGKHAKARLSKTFSRNYEPHTFQIITPESIDEFLCT